MTTPSALSLLTYLWHYLVARLLYDHLLRPLEHGDATGVVLLVFVAAVGFVLGRRTRGRA